jgi:DNA-binding MarR family transcriptional regulator
MELTTIRRFRKCIRHLERELDLQGNSCCSTGVSLVQCHALLEIDLCGSVSLGELSEKLYLDKSTVSRTVDSLARSKLVNRDTPDDNRRKINISLTDKGRDVCDQINRDNDEYFANVLRAIPEKDMTVFMRSLESLIRRMIEWNRIKNDRCRNGS